MKIAITGHTLGIGKALAEVYQQHGHAVVGFSRSTGHDISTIDGRTRIITESADCDLFFNNAHADFSQCDLLFELWMSWKNQKKYIVNISSAHSVKWVYFLKDQVSDIKYCSVKKALEESAEFLWNQLDWPAVSIVSPCRTDTPRVAHRDWSNKVDPTEFANLVYTTLIQNNFRVQRLSLANRPID
jgi:hypothetical protein